MKNIEWFQAKAQSSRILSSCLEVRWTMKSTRKQSVHIESNILLESVDSPNYISLWPSPYCPHVSANHTQPFLIFSLLSCPASEVGGKLQPDRGPRSCVTPAKYRSCLLGVSSRFVFLGCVPGTKWPASPLTFFRFLPNWHFGLFVPVFCRLLSNLAVLNQAIYSHLESLICDDFIFLPS